MKRDDFPQLTSDLIYLDNAATTFKPMSVLNALDDFYRNKNANAKRGLYKLSYNAECLCEEARHEVADFIGADGDEIIFTRGATESINLVANGLSFTTKDEIVICITEHHSNMLPWRKTGAKIKYLYCNKDGAFLDENIDNVISDSTRLVAVTAYSNVLGKNHQLEKIIKRAHSVGALVVVDAAQAIAHEKINVKKMDADFLAFSGHKIYGPMGIGVLFVKKKYLEQLEPLLFGGEMVDSVTTEDFILSKTPERFEAGTMNIAGAIVLAEALRYLKNNNFDELLDYEQELNNYAFNKLGQIPYLELAGARTLNYYPSIQCFWLRDVHSHDISAFLDSRNIATRAGYQCAQPLLDYLGKGPTTRISLCFYNTFEEVDKLCDALAEVRQGMGIK